MRVCMTHKATEEGPLIGDSARVTARGFEFEFCNSVTQRFRRKQLKHYSMTQ